MEGRVLLVMEGGHPWGFRIEGGAEVQQPIRINKVLDGGKAFCHGMEVGDILSSINGENADHMTISRARHLVRTSDNLLVLEVTRPRRDKPQIPEIRIISPSESPVNGANQSLIANEVPETRRSQPQKNFATNAMDRLRNFANSAMGRLRPRTATSQLAGSSRSTEPGSRPVPPPKPPLAMRNAATTQRYEDAQKPVTFTYPGSPSPPVLFPDGRDPSIAAPPSCMSTSQSVPVIRKGLKVDDTRPLAPKKPDYLKSNLPVENVNTQSGYSFQKRNTEPAPIKSIGYDAHKQAEDKLAEYDDQRMWSKKVNPTDMKQFRYRTTDAGPMKINQPGSRTSLPLSSAEKPSLSEDQFELVDLFIKEDPYDFLPSRQGKVLHAEGQTRPTNYYQNPYSTGKNEILRSSRPLEKSWPRKFELPEARYYPTVSSTEPDMHPNYEHLPSRHFHQGVKVLNPDIGRRDQMTMKEHFLYPGPPVQRVATRQKLDEENLRRKLEIERVIAEERKRRILKDQMAESARRHSDNLSPAERRSFLMDRFSDDEVAEALARPARRVYTKIRGKARALYTFRAQSSRELSFKRNDIIYILRQIDKNWYEGERHGMVGIFPITYVEVITSLDEAKATAILREGTATAIYNFKAQTDIELPLRKGDLVTLVRRVDQNWYEGRIGRQQGIFPVTYVDTHREPDTPMVTPMSSLAPTPVPGTPNCQSPVSSIYSAGPDIPSAPMSPLDSEFYESDWDSESLGALQSGRPLRTSRPTSPTDSDRDITPVRVINSPVPSDAEIRSLTSPPPGNRPIREVLSLFHNGAAPRSVISPPPGSAAVKGRLSNISSAVPNRTVLSPVPNDLSARRVTSPPPSSASVRTLITSPVSFAGGDSRVSVDGRKVEKPAVPPKLFLLPNKIPKGEDQFNSAAVNKERKNPVDSNEPHQMTKSANIANSPSPIKADPMKQRPPSGRPPSVTPKSTRQRPGTKQPSTETRDRREGFSKSSRSQNPYMRYRAVYNYKPQNIDELELTRGDVIFVMEKCADGWYVGISDRTKQFGTFPGNFVRPMW